MALPELINGPYIFNVNNRYQESSVALMTKSVMFRMKDCLVALGGAETIWKVIASCNAVTVWNIDPEEPNRDLWEDLGDIVYSGGNHSWAILENQVTGGQLCLDYPYGFSYYGAILYSADGTFAADGTLSARPTATESQFLTGSPYSGVASNACVAFTMHVMTSADKKTTRVFIVETSATTIDWGGWCLLIEEARETPTQWTSENKTVVWQNTALPTVAEEPYSASPKLSDFQAASLYARIVTDEPYSGWLSCYPTVPCIDLWNAYSLIATPLDRNIYEGEFSGGHLLCPIGLYKEGTTHSGPFGSLRDIYLAPRYHPIFTTYPNDLTRKWIKFGSFIVPWDGSNPVRF